MTEPNGLGDAITELVSGYCASLPDQIAQLRALDLDVAETSDAAEAGLQSAYAIAHAITGASGAMGFEALSRAAGELQLNLKGRLGMRGGVEDATPADTKRLLDTLDREIARATPARSTLLSRDLAMLEAIGPEPTLPEAGPAAPGSPERAQMSRRPAS